MICDMSDLNAWDECEQGARDEIAQEDRYNRERNRHLRDIADWIAGAMATVPGVERIVLFGSVARPPTMTVPHARRLRRFGIQITRKCGDLDLAVEMSDLTCLRALQRARNTTVGEYLRATDYGIAQHMIDVFIIEPGTGNYLGRLCQFNRCPNPGKWECYVPSCGETRHLQQHADFTLEADALSPDRSVVLFDRQASHEPNSD